MGSHVPADMELLKRGNNYIAHTPREGQEFSCPFLETTYLELTIMSTCPELTLVLGTSPYCGAMVSASDP